MSKKVLDILKRKFGDAIEATHSDCGDDTACVKRESLLDICEFLKESDDTAFDHPIDVTCVDYLTYPEPRPFATRFAVVYHLRSMRHNHRVRLKVAVPEDDAVVDSVASIWKGLVWFEREVFDMFGVRFNGHPDLRRLLTYPEFVGHPLRKDYPRRGYQPTIPMPTVKGDPVPGVHFDSDEE